MMNAPPLIALVNDDEDLLQLLQEAFMLEGYCTVTARIGRDAMEMIRCSRPTLVVLDLWMESHETGLEVLRTLRENLATQAVPVIVCTAAANYVMRVQNEIEMLGATVLPKPFDLDVLFARVKAELS